jgi:hypothetical protein
LFLHSRLSKEKAFAGAYHGSGESRTFQLNSGHPLFTVREIQIYIVLIFNNF